MSDIFKENTRRKWVLHDYMQVNGGAERLVSTITRNIANFSLGVSGIYPAFSESANTAGINIEIVGKTPKFIPRIPKAIITFSSRMPCIEHAEVVVYSGIYSPLAVREKGNGKQIYYCHTPPRFALDRKKQYLEKIPYLIQPIVSIAIDKYHDKYQSCIRKMDLVLTNSRNTQARIYREYGVNSEVVYPPINTTNYKWLNQCDYYLSLGRLEPNKRVDLIIEAFMNMPEKKLVVASGGSQLNFLRAMAGQSKNIYFLDWVCEEKLIELIGNSLASIYIPLDEDFGMSAVESMSAGKPVIGVAEGGLMESVIDGVTGILLPKNPQVEDICTAVHAMTKSMALSMRGSCEDRANYFSEANFISQIESYI
jgi:glycosyltransferase involved in cell wall biosynthesis